MKPSRSSLMEIIKEVVTGEELREAVVYIVPEITRGEVITINREKFTIDEPSILLFIDFGPGVNWSHKCRYLLVDYDGKVQQETEGQFPPDAERLQLFLKPTNVQDWMLLTDKIFS